MGFDSQKETILQTLRHDPNDTDALQALGELYRTEGRWVELATVLEELGSQVEDRLARVRFHFVAARIWEGQVGDGERAEQAYEQVLELDPGNLDAIDALKSCQLRLERWEGLARTLEREAGSRDVPGDLADIHFELATLLEVKLARPQDALRHYQLAFRSDPSCVKALDAARAIYAGQERWPLVAQLYRLEAETTAEPRARAALLLQQGRLLRDRLADAAGANQVLEEALSLDPDNEVIFQELEQCERRLTEPAPAPAESASPPPVAEGPAVEPRAVAAEGPAPTPKKGRKGEEVSTGRAAESGKSAKKGKKKGRKAEERAEDDEQATATPLPASAASPAVEPLVEPLVEPAVEPLVEPLVEPAALEAAASPEPPPTLAPAPAAEPLPAPAAEPPVLEQASSPEPGPASPVEEAPPDDVADQPPAVVVPAELPGPVAIGLTADGRILAPQAEGGLPFAEYRALLQEAAAAAGEGSNLAKDHKEAELTADGNWRDLQTALRQRHGNEATGRVAQARRLGVLAEWAGVPDKAIDAWRQVLQGEPSDLEAKDALKRLYRATSKWNAVVDLLKREVDELPESAVAQKVARYQEMVAIYRDNLHLDAMVTTTYQNLLKIDPRNAEAIDTLAEQFEKMRRWPDLVGILQKKVELLERPDEKIALYKRLASLFAERFSNQAEAIKAHEAVLQLSPDDREAMAFLEEMYEKRRDWEKLIDVHERQALLIEDADRRADALSEVARLAVDKLKRSSRPTELWERVLTLRQEDSAALDALEEIHDRNKDWPNLARILRQKVELEAEPVREAEQWEKLGRLYGERLRDGEQAVACWQRVLSLQPDHARAREALKRAYIEANDWDSLTAHYAERDDWKELVRILESQVGVLQDDALKVDLLFRAAAVYEEKLEQPDRAVRALERVLSIDERNLKASVRLIPVYEEKKDYKRLIRCHEVRLAYTEEIPARREILTTLAGLCQAKVNEPAAAFRWLLLATRENPDDVGLRADLERLAGQLQTWEEVVALYRESRAALAERPASLLQLELALGRALAEELGETSESMDAFLRALQLDPDCRTALYALEGLYKRTGRWDDLLDNLGRSVVLADDPLERRRLLVDTALVEEEQLGDPLRAAATYRRVLEEAPEDQEALQSLHRLLVGQERWEELAPVLERELAVAVAGGAPEAEIVALQLELGRVLHHQLARTTEAVGCFADILGRVPDHEEAIGELEGLLDRVELLPRLFAILDPTYEGSSSWAKLVDLLERRLILLAEDPGEQLDTLLRKAELQDVRLADGPAAFVTYGRACKVDPEDERGRAQLEALAERLECWGELVALYRELAGGSLPVALTTHLYLTVARVEDEKLGRAKDAEEAYRAVLELDPDSRPALDALEQLYTRSESWERLVEVYQRKRDLAPDATTREAICFRIGFLWEELLGNLVEATETYKGILDENPNSDKALEALDRLYSARQMPPELAENLRRQLGRATGEASLALTLRLAALLEGELNEQREAIELYRTVLDRRPGDPEATRALERLLEDLEHRLAIALILEPHYRTSSDWEKLVGVLEIQLAAADDSFEKLDLLHRIARLKEQELGSPEAAFLTYGRALSEQPADERTRENLHRLAELLGNWAELVGLYEEEVTRLADPELSASFHTTCARIYEERLDKIDGALTAWRRVLEIQPENLAVMDSLIRLLKSTEQWVPLVEMLLAKTEVVGDVEEKIDLLAQAATLYEEMLDQPGRAIEIHRRVLQLDDRQREALDALQRLYEQEASWPALHEIYERQVALADTDAEKKRLLALAGKLLDEQLDDRGRAIETYRSLLDLDPLDEQTLVALDRLLGLAGDWVGQLEILERQAELAASGAQRTKLQFRIASLWDGPLDDPLRAIDGYREILAAGVEHEGARRALTELVRQGREAQGAADVLLPLHKELGEWPAAVELIELWLPHVTDPPSRIGLLEEAARIREDHLDDRVAAFETLARALREQPAREETLEALEALSARAGLFERYVQLVEAEAQAQTQDPGLAVGLLLRVARVLEEELVFLPEAIERFKRILELSADEAVAIESLDRLYQRQGRWEELAALLRQKIALTTSVEERLGLTMRLGALLESVLDAVPDGIATYREVLAEDPQHAEAIAALERLFASGNEPLTVAAILAPLYEDERAWEKLIALKAATLPHLADPQVQREVIKEAALLGLEKMDRPDLALSWYGRCYVLAPDDDEVGLELERLARLTGGWPQLVEIYREAHGRSQESAPRRAILQRVARVFEEELGDKQSAEQAFVGVLHLDEEDREALAALDRIYQSEGRWADLAAILQREIQLEEDERAVIGLVYRLARLHEHQLGDLDLAVDHYRNILQADPLHEGALKALESIYVQREEWEPLFDIYQKQADIADSGELKAGIYAKMANLAAEMLERPSDAITMWNKVIDLLGDDLDALRSLAGLHQQQGQWRELVEVLERQARVVGVPAEEVNLLARQGRILSQQLGDDGEAQRRWQQVLAIEPAHVEALLSLRQLYRQSQSWEELVDVLERLLDLRQGTLEEQATLWAELGRLQADLLGRPDAAIAAWRQVLGLRPEEMEAITSLERLYELQEDWPACVEVLELKAERLSEREAKAETLLRVATLCLEKTYARDRAVTFLEGVLELDPPNLRASAMLEQIFEEDGDASRLLDVLLRRLEHSADVGERVGMLQRAATLCEERLGNPVNAFYCISRAFQEVPGDGAVSGELERLARASSQWETLLDLYEGMIPSAEPDLQVDLHRRIGRIYAEELDAPAEAITAYQQVLRARRNDPDALASLERLFRQARRWPELVAVLQLRVEAEEDADLLAVHYNTMGEILEEQLRSTDKAVEAYRQVLKQREDDETALGALERIFTREGRWRELIDILSRRATATLEADRVIAFKTRIGEIWENQLQVADRAIEAYREILRLDPFNVDSCRALERLYTAQDKWRDLVEVYGIWLAATDDPRQQADLLTKTAAIHEEEFHDAPAAIEAFEQILQVQPDSETAIRSLERLYRDQKRWPELIEVYRRHLDVAGGDREVSVFLLLATGAIFADMLGDRDQAIDAYRRILDFDPAHQEALQRLAGLFEQAEEWDATVGMLQQLRAVIEDKTQRVALGYRIGQLQLQQIQDAAKAEDWFYQVLEEDPLHLPSIEALRDMAYGREDWRGAVLLLKRQEEATRDLTEKAKTLLAIGNIYQQRENDPLAASTYFERCVELDPENVEAASPLVEMYLQERRWERAEPLLELLVRRLGKSRHTDGIHLIHYQAGLVSENLFKDEKALRHYRNAYELDATHLPTLEGLGRLLYKREDWDRAFKIYQTILVHHRERQTVAQQVEIFYRLGVIKLKVGERARGRQLFEKALELDAHHRPSLEALIDLHEKQGDWERVIECKRATLATLEGEDLKRFDLLVDIANTWREKLRNIPKSIEAYNEALRIDPQSRQVMHHLLNLYTQEKQWPYAVEILLRTIQLEDRPDKIARYCYTAGVIYRDELKDDEHAVELFNQALDADPGLLRAFEAIDRIQTRNKAWPQLERNYRKMIKRVGDTGVGGDDLQVLLWRNLGEIYRTRMGKLDEAATAFTMASRIKPADMQLHEIIAELYGRMPEAKEKALAEHRRMLELEKFRYSSYKALHRLFLEIGQYDKAWCVSAALSLARQASSEEEEFYQKYRSPTIKYANRPIDREMWTNALYHPMENLHLGGIFAILASYNPFPTSQLKDWDLKKRDLHDQTKPLLFNKVFKSTVQALNMATAIPNLYLKRENHVGLKNGYTEPWSMILGPDMLQGRPDRELAFLLGKYLTYYRPEHYLATVLPVTHLKVLFFAAWKLTHPEANVPAPAEQESFNEILRLLQKSIPPPILVDLHKRVSTVIRFHPELNLSEWVDGVDATSNRVGLLLCGDLETATRLIQSEQGAIGKLGAQERSEDLYLWSISEDYFGLRKALGLTIG